MGPPGRNARAAPSRRTVDPYDAGRVCAHCIVEHQFAGRAVFLTAAYEGYVGTGPVPRLRPKSQPRSRATMKSQ